MHWPEKAITIWKKKGWKYSFALFFLLVIGYAAYHAFSSYIDAFFSDLGHYSFHRVLKENRQTEKKQTGTSKVIVLQKAPLHVGNTDKPNYPAQKEAGLIKYEYEVFFNQKPQKVTISVEVFDVDTIGGEILFNGNHIGSFSIGDLWHKDTFIVEQKYLKKGRNTVTVKTNILRTGKMEDFRFRNLKLFVDY